MDLLTHHVYTHYKTGGRYLMLCVAEDSTNARDTNKVVVYVDLTNGVVRCRDLSEFTESVEWPDGSMRPRFVPE